MYIYSSLHEGEYFLFFPDASASNPVKILFQEHEHGPKRMKPAGGWRENVLLMPSILPRKWIDYKYRDRFIPAVKFDNVLPCEIGCALLNTVDSPTVIALRSPDKEYRSVEVRLIDTYGFTVFRKQIESLTSRKSVSLEAVVRKPGRYRVALSDGSNMFEKTSILFHEKERVRTMPGPLSPGSLVSREGGFEGEEGLFCGRCGCRVYPVKSRTVPRYIFKNYIPFKRFLDLDRADPEEVGASVMRTGHPAAYRKGLVHLLNIIRLATIDDELAIVTSLFKDNPSFAYFVTDRLFMLEMVPLMADRELQAILNSIDDRLIARAMKGYGAEASDKIVRNLSSRRRRFVQQTSSRIAHDASESSDARDEMSRRIRLYFEERIGRTLRIPVDDRLLYFPPGAEGDPAPDDEFLVCHSGSYILSRGRDAIRWSTGPGTEECVRFDVERRGEPVFLVAGVSDTTLYLRCELALNCVLVHTYQWFGGLEDVEFVEHLPSRVVLPVPMKSPALILTIGAVSEHGKPMEQVIRLKVKETADGAALGPGRDG